jgi:hypothetical protein
LAAKACRNRFRQAFFCAGKHPRPGFKIRFHERSLLAAGNKQSFSGRRTVPQVEFEQNFEYRLDAEHSPQQHMPARDLFSFWKEIDFQTVIM